MLGHSWIKLQYLEVFKNQTGTILANKHIRFMNKSAKPKKHIFLQKNLIYKKFES